MKKNKSNQRFIKKTKGGDREAEKHKAVMDQMKQTEEYKQLLPYSKVFSEAEHYKRLIDASNHHQMKQTADKNENAAKKIQNFGRTTMKGYKNSVDRDGARYYDALAGGKRNGNRTRKRNKLRKRL